MRFLLINNHCVSDPTAGITHCFRTLGQWLIEAGHECRVLTTARFEADVSFTIEEHLESLGVDVPASTARRPVNGKTAKERRRKQATRRKESACPTVEYQIGPLPVTLLMTRHNDEREPHRKESQQYLKLFESLLDDFQPDQMIAVNSHLMVQQAIKRAKERGIITVFSVRGYGYDDVRFFDHVDHVFTCSQLLTDYHTEHVGLPSTPIEPPIEWSEVIAPTEARAFVTFVHPAPHKGIALFARLADMLGSRREDIPIMIVQSGRSAGSLNTIRGIDFTKYPQIMAAPPVPKPADYFELTRILLVPSLWEEPFGRVAVEAMINGIPPIVTDRGYLPQAVGGDFSEGGGGRVLPAPDWLEWNTNRLPSEEEIEPWFDAVCELWDDPELYKAISARAQKIAQERYSEEVSRAKHVSYLTSLKP